MSYPMGSGDSNGNLAIEGGSSGAGVGDDVITPAGGGQEAAMEARDQDRYLPIANISRIMKKVLPANAKVAKDAKETVQMCVSEFISFITSEASDKCVREKRKTINGDDMLWALTTLGFENYVEPMKVYLYKFRELEAKKGEKAGVVKRVARKVNQEGTAGGQGPQEA